MIKRTLKSPLMALLNFVMTRKKATTFIIFFFEYFEFDLKLTFSLSKKPKHTFKPFRSAAQIFPADHFRPFGVLVSELQKQPSWASWCPSWGLVGVSTGWVTWRTKKNQESGTRVWLSYFFWGTFSGGNGNFLIVESSECITIAGLNSFWWILYKNNGLLHCCLSDCMICFEIHREVRSLSLLQADISIAFNCYVEF